MFVDIECPACEQGVIKLSPQMLAQGSSFACNMCAARISVSESSKQKVLQGVQAYDSYKKTLTDLQQQGNNPDIM